MEFMSMKFHDMFAREAQLRSNVRELESRFDKMEKSQIEILHILRNVAENVTRASSRLCWLTFVPCQVELGKKIFALF